jgi:preprotein translocase subunit SecA
MLRIIDQRWREHLYEMDYLQEGINLRAMGQKDPLVEWQREGFEMFGQMMKGIAVDFVRYVMHVQVVTNEEPEPAEVQNVQYTSAEDVTTTGLQAAAAQAAAAGEIDPELIADDGDTPEMQPIIKDGLYDKVGRNDPCPCGSGKKFKVCHGKAT